MMTNLVNHRPATREDVAARYPATTLDEEAAIATLRAYFIEMMEAVGEVPPMCQGPATPVGAYQVNGAVVYHYQLVEPVGDIVGYTLSDGDLKVPVAVRGGDVLPALWNTAGILQW